MSDNLYSIYKDAAGSNVETVYVFPRIEISSIYNPYLKLLYDDLNEISVNSVNPILPKFLFKKFKGEKSVVHYHWLEFCNLKEFLILIYKLFLLFIYKLSGGEIVWTMHNLTPHCKKFKKANFLIRKWMIRIVKYIILHSEHAKPAVCSLYRIPVKMIKIVPHPKYKVNIQEKQMSIERINKLYRIHIKNSKPLFLMYGRISRYKGILEVIKIFIKNDFQLIIAGDTAKESIEYVNIIKELSKKTKNINIINKFIPSNEEELIFGASDVAIFNFSKMLSSGSILLAESYKKNIIAPKSSIRLVENSKDINTFSDHEELSELIEHLNFKISDSSING